MQKEIQFIQKLTSSYRRSPGQRNRVFETDAEIVQLEDGRFFVGSLDTVSEEIRMGLLRDPKSLAWLTATASVSDLSAVGVKTAAAHFLFSGSAFWQQKGTIEEGIQNAQAFYQWTDTRIEFVEKNSSQTWSLCAASVIVEKAPRLSRLNLEPGQKLYLTGPVGWGNAVAFANIAVRPQNAAAADGLDQTYRPLGHVNWVETLNEFAASCVDTSDGCLMTLDLLMQLNPIGLEIDYRAELLHPTALQVSSLTKVPPWLFFAGQNGEFQLLFAVAADQTARFESECGRRGLFPLALGRVTERDLHFQMQNRRQKIQIDQIRNLLHEGTQPAEYIRSLVRFGEENQIHV
jgi:thiamine monophosphate kinase